METSAELTSGREPAPGRLRLVQELLNSYEADLDRDELADLDALAAWLRSRELIGPAERLAGRDLERARSFREALRALLEERPHGAVRSETRRAINDGSGAALLRVELDAAGAPRLLGAASGLDGAFAQLLAIIAEAALDGTWARLKVCERPACRWAFYDRSKNRSGSWCSMAVCGNRAKAH